MGAVEPTTTPAAAIPTIDLLAFDNGDREAIACEVDRACRSTGFFLIAGHGVPTDALGLVQREARDFFDLPTEAKAECTSSFLGYRGLHTLRASTKQPSSVTDAKETFTVAREPIPDDTSEFTASNAWPAGRRDFRERVLAHYATMARVSADIGRLLAAALVLPDDFFAARADRQLSWLTLINYPEGQGGRRFGEHRDRGCFTVLSTTGPGLEVRDAYGVWHRVPVPADGFVVNVGSMLANWSGRRWVSPMHRVVDDGARRQSIVFFFNPNHDVSLDPLPAQGLGRVGVSTGPSVTVGDYLRSMLKLYR